MRVIGGITDANGSRCFYIMSELSEIFSYNGNDVTFKTVDDVTYVNATEMAKYFNRRTNDYLSLVSTNALVKAITRKTGKSENQLVIKKTGMPVFGGGVWLHEDIAIDFAQWLSVDFKLWCTDKIKELLLKGHTSINRSNSDISRRDLPSDYIEALEADDEFYGTNTVYVTPKGFQWIVSKISKEWMSRFLELKGRVLSRSDKDIFAKR